MCDVRDEGIYRTLALQRAGPVIRRMPTRFHYYGITSCLYGRALQNKLCKTDLEPKGI
jgi:hypothetical protein